MGTPGLKLRGRAMQTVPIDVREVRKSFKGNEVLHGLTLQIDQGQIVGLVGPSGCGKTTLVDLIVGLTLPDSGSITIRGEQAPYPTMRRSLGFMPQDTALYEDITGQENLSFFGSLYGMSTSQIRAASKDALELARLDEQGKKIVSAYSGGMKRRLSLAVALLTSPEILVLDEPTIGLDPVHREKLWKTFRELAQAGASILITTHMMDEAARCDRIAMIREGRLICFDAPDSIIELSGQPDLESAFITLAEQEFPDQESIEQESTGQEGGERDA